MATSVPSGFGHLMNPQHPHPASRRLGLFLRQQPVAARSCGTVDKGRRSIDPLPILQLLIEDFSPYSDADRARLTYKQYVVGCQLFAISRSSNGSEQRTHCSNIVEQGSDRHGTQLLSGRIWVSPFFVEADPEPDRAPAHPRSGFTPNQAPAPQSKLTPIPSTFFIFNDLCVRTA